ncbi:hypothetical protein BBJ28_00004987 [Nothophytophthora sp. Chile5]|nr:hypothetical protein BBJ28_00004987 [Nothophytophthora sp. Chile5]
MSTTAISWMSTTMPMPQMTDDSVESSKQILKALKCVAFSNMQVGSMIKRKRERLVNRIQAIHDETELLRADIMENVINQRQRLTQMVDIEEDIERAQTLANAEMVKNLVDELKAVQEEDRRENVLLRNLKRTVRSRRRVHKGLIEEKSAVEASMAIFTCKQSLIQSMLSTCSKTTFITSESASEEDEDEESSSASQSDCDSRDLDHSEANIDMDVDFAMQSSQEYPQLRIAQPEEESAADQSSISAWSFDSDSQTSSTVKDGRRRSVSFSPLPPRPLADLAEEDVNMNRQFVEDVQSGSDDDERVSSGCEYK